MGLIYANLLVTNYRDLANAEDHFIKPDQIRQKEVTFLVDTVAYMSVLPQSLCEELGLRITSRGLNKHGMLTAGFNRLALPKLSNYDSRIYQQ